MTRYSRSDVESNLARQLGQRRLSRAACLFDRAHFSRRSKAARTSGVFPFTGPGIKPRAEEDPRQGVVVLGRDRIELVIVAAGTGQRQPQKGAAHHVDLIIHVVGDHLLLVDVAGNEIGDGQQAGGDQAVFVDLRRIGRLQQIARDLLCG